MGANENITWWQEIRGTAAVIRNLEASRAATLRLGSAQAVQGRAAEEAAHRGFLLNQVVFTGRRLLYAGTLATIAFAGAMGALGFQFNLTMESNRVALNHFLGSASLTTKELNYLYQVAAKTPFEFADVTSAARKFLAFGYTLQQTNKYLNVIGDTVAGIGGSSADIEGLVTVFGQIQATGRVMGQDMLQLSQRGIPALQILRRELGLTSQQMGNIGNLAIPASVAIPALMRGMDKIFHGAAREQSRTLRGQLSTLHDYAAQLMGTLTLPMFNRFRNHIIPQLGGMVQEMQKAAKAGASTTDIVAIADRHLGAGGRLLNFYKLFSNILEIVRNVLVNGVIPALYITGKVFSGVYFAAYPVLQILKFITRQQWLLMGVLIPLITILSVEATIWFMVRSAIVATMIVKFLLLRWTNLMIAKQAVLNALQLISYARTNKQARAEVDLFLSRMKLFRVVSLLIGGTKAWTAAALLQNRAANGQFAKGYRYNNLLARTWRLVITRVIPSIAATTTAVVAQTAALWAATTAWIAMNTAMLGWIGLAIAIVAALVILYFKWQAFHDIVNKVFNLLMKYPVLAVFLGPIIGPIIIATRLIKTLYDWGRKLYDLFAHPLRIKISFPSVGGLAKSYAGYLGRVAFPVTNIPGVPRISRLWGGQSGGVVQRMSTVLVGEKGPEVLQLPAGASVHPLPQPAGFPGEFFGGYNGPKILELRIPLNVDGRQLAEVVSQHRLDRKARR